MKCLNMKTPIILFTVYLCSLLPAFAQQFNRIFLFDDFVEAQIKFRNHSTSIVSLNYDASNKEMLFLQGKEVMEITNAASIDTIIVEKRKFVPAVPKGFYEVIAQTHGDIYVDWLLKDVNIGSKGALGAVTQGSVHNLQMSNLGLNGTEMYTPYKQQKLGSTDVYRRKNDNTYYIRLNKKLVKVKTIKHLEKIFPNHKEDIRKYAKTKEINMKDVQDVLDILDYCMKFNR